MHSPQSNASVEVQVILLCVLFCFIGLHFDWNLWFIRYDREVDEAEKSCLKKILQTDDTPSKPMVLYCADIYKLDSKLNDTINDKQVIKFEIIFLIENVLSLFIFTLI